jgi:CP family cyanate transporter-like MFS transporter
MVAPDDVPRFSAGVFTIGYGLAMVISILGGIAWDVSRDAAYAFAPVTVAAFFIILFALLTDFSRRQF